jgi:hypothetical protein
MEVNLQQSIAYFAKLSGRLVSEEVAASISGGHAERVFFRIRLRSTHKIAGKFQFGFAVQVEA